MQCAADRRQVSFRRAHARSHRIGRSGRATVVSSRLRKERGTKSYNLALGERRASSVRDYLVFLGIAPQRIQIISYGEERPFALGSGESVWKLNRRSHFVIVAR